MDHDIYVAVFGYDWKRLGSKLVTLSDFVINDPILLNEAERRVALLVTPLDIKDVHVVSTMGREATPEEGRLFYAKNRGPHVEAWDFTKRD